jgi:hypothetical protein
MTDEEVFRMRTIPRTMLAGTLGLAAIVVPAAPAAAHEQRDVGDLSLVVGWSGEPTYAGFLNEVQLIISRRAAGGGEEGPPVEDADIQVEVLFGGEDAEQATQPLPLEPAFDTPGEYLAPIIPSRPGTYSFHFTGTAGGQEIDEVFTSGPDTFSDVEVPADISFPAQDPTAGDLARAVAETQSDAREMRAVVEDAESQASSARTMALVGIVVGVLGLIVAGVALVRRRSAP